MAIAWLRLDGGVGVERRKRGSVDSCVGGDSAWGCVCCVFRSEMWQRTPLRLYYGERASDGGVFKPSPSPVDVYIHRPGLAPDQREAHHPFCSSWVKRKTG